MFQVVLLLRVSVPENGRYRVAQPAGLPAACGLQVLHFAQPDADLLDEMVAGESSRS